MKSNTIVVTHWVHPEVIALMAPHAELVLNQTRQTLPVDELFIRMQPAQAMLAFMPDSVDDAFLERCPHLKVIGAALKGYDNFDVAACTRRGVWLTIVPDLLTLPTAELAVGLMLGLVRNIGAGDRLVRSGNFQGWRPVLYGTSLTGATVGILGMGRVGRAIASLLTGFEATVIYCDPHCMEPAQERVLLTRSVSLEALLCRSDHVICAAPLTQQTRHLINPRTIARMRPGSFLINIGRGSVVDEQAVAVALGSGHLAGYAADVFEMEDWALPDRPRSIAPALLAHKEKTIFTPHLGSAVDAIRKEITMEAARNILQALAGQRPQGAVNQVDCSRNN